MVKTNGFDDFISTYLDGVFTQSDGIGVCDVLRNAVEQNMGERVQRSEPYIRLLSECVSTEASVSERRVAGDGRILIIENSAIFLLNLNRTFPLLVFEEASQVSKNILETFPYMDSLLKEEIL